MSVTREQKRLRLDRAAIRRKVKDIAELYEDRDEGDYHGFVHHDGSAWAEWNDYFCSLGYESRLEYDENDYVSGIWVASEYGHVTLAEPYDVTEDEGRGLVWTVTDAAMDRCADCILSLATPRGTSAEIARQAVADLRRARDRLLSIGAVKAAQRVRFALRSADGAVRHASLEPYRTKRQQQAKAKGKAA